MTLIYASVNYAIIGSVSGLSPVWHQTISYTNGCKLSIGPSVINVSEIWMKMLQFSFEKINSYMSSAKWWPFCLGINVFNKRHRDRMQRGWYYPSLLLRTFGLVKHICVSELGHHWVKWVFCSKTCLATMLIRSFSRGKNARALQRDCSFSSAKSNELTQ